MNANRPRLVRNTPEEEAEIAKQIAENPDEAEWTDEDWANSMTSEQLSPEFAMWAVPRRNWPRSDETHRLPPSAGRPARGQGR